MTENYEMAMTSDFRISCKSGTAFSGPSPARGYVVHNGEPSLSNHVEGEDEWCTGSFGIIGDD
jgi:hypothetical protein